MIADLLALAASAGFQFEQSKDPITDAVSARAFVTNDVGGFAIKCDKPGPKSVYIQISTREYLGGRGAGPGFRDVILRTDERPAGTATGLYYGHSVILNNFENEVRPISLGVTNATRLTARVTTYDFRQIDLIFPNLTGAAEAVVRVYKACDPEAMNQMVGRKVF